MSRTRAIENELEVVERLLVYGLASLGQINPRAFGPNDPVFVTFLQLSSAYERLFKCVLWAEGADRDDPLSEQAFKPGSGYGHQLVTMLQDIRGRCYVDRDLPEHPAAREDYEFLGSDIVQDFVRLLEGYTGTEDRYHFLTIAGTEEPEARRRLTYEQDPVDKWRTFEVKLTNWSDEIDEPVDQWTGIGNPVEEYMPRLEAVRVAFVRRTVRALARLFSEQVLGGSGVRLTGLMHAWAEMPDGALAGSFRSALDQYDAFGSSRELEPIVYHAVPLDEFPDGPAYESEEVG